MSWLEKRARKQCEFNIQINTRTLVAASNRADANLKESGHQVNPGDAKEVNDAQRRLRDDIVLGLSNGLTLDQIRQEQHTETEI